MTGSSKKSRDMAENRSTSLSYRCCLILGIAALVAYADTSAKEDSLSKDAKAKFERDIRSKRRRNTALESLVRDLRKRITPLEQRLVCHLFWLACPCIFAPFGFYTIKAFHKKY